MGVEVGKFDPARYKETTLQQWQAAAAAWHRWGPTLDEWLGAPTRVMLDLAQTGPGQRVLDVAAGAGGQSLEAARRVGPTGYVLATDISPNILSFARAAAAAADVHNMDTRVVDGEEIDLPEESFDVVISRVGLIYFPDQHKALTSMRRVLKPNGRVAAITYSTPENNKFFSVPVSIIRRRARLPAPLPGQPGPFSLGAPGVLEAALLRAGFREVRVCVVPAPLRLPSASECVRFERESFGALHQMLGAMTEAEKGSIWAEIETELKQFQTDEGFLGPCEMLVAVGTK
ncbi:MAG TPA: methyltransferase domain-containing protein [Steroidobacteraceae bacterium]|nr:methyltransferase domain-containing protein [Steroidobacteraceae bacterium]